MSRRCRSCGSGGVHQFLDLGELPLPDALLTTETLHQPEPRFPLRVGVCAECSLVQLLDDVAPEAMFVENYHYYSSFADTVLQHAARHATNLVDRFGLDTRSLVVEIGSNDGYFLRNLTERGVRVLGVDPSPGPADAAERAGVPTVREFLDEHVGQRLRDEHGPADVVVANNVMAHVPDPASFARGLAALVAPDGVITVENPSVHELIERRAFDTIYHEHTCYYSCLSMAALVSSAGLHLNDVEYFPDLHGGTLRWWISPRAGRSERLEARLAAERETGLDRVDHYADFGAAVSSLIGDLRELVGGLAASESGVAAYGAAAKGSILLNATGLDTELVGWVVDRNPHKHGRFMPGTHQPILPTEALTDRRPGHVVLLAWNFADEIVRQQAPYLETGGRFVVPIPEPKVLP